MKRMWINQPSTLQPLHHLHGTNVLAEVEKDGTLRVWFLSGDVIDMQVPRGTLGFGWAPKGWTMVEAGHEAP